LIAPAARFRQTHAGECEPVISRLANLFPASFNSGQRRCRLAQHYCPEYFYGLQINRRLQPAI
jgi:hypothetical protein